MKSRVGGIWALLLLAAGCLLLPGRYSAQGEEPAAEKSRADVLRALAANPSAETRRPAFAPVIPTKQADTLRSSQVAATRLTVHFGGAPGTEGPIEASHGTEKTQLPVIAAIFVTEECESVLTAEEFRSRPDRRASLAYRVYSAPKNFGPYGLLLEHWHANEAHRTLIKTSRFANLPTFETQRISISGLLPGVNEFRLLVHIEDASGTKTVSDASTHLVVVHEVAALSLTKDTAVGFSAQDLPADRVAYRGDALWQASFVLSPALDAGRMQVRVQRRGTRKFEDARLPAGVQRDVGAESSIGTWQEIAALPLTGGELHGVLVQSMGERRYAVRLTHVLRVSSTLAPMSDDWEYRVSLQHPNIADAVEVITAHVRAEIGGTSGNWFGVGDNRDQVVRVVPERIGLAE